MPNIWPAWVANLRQLPRETEWVEFKVNRADPEDIGEYISALANGAALNGKESAYLLWGIADGTHAVVGTRFVPAAAKKGNEPLENWLRHGLTPRVDFRFHEVAFDGKRVVVLEIEPAPAAAGGFQQGALCSCGQRQEKPPGASRKRTGVVANPRQRYL